MLDNTKKIVAIIAGALASLVAIVTLVNSTKPPEPLKSEKICCGTCIVDSNVSIGSSHLTQAVNCGNITNTIIQKNN